MKVLNYLMIFIAGIMIFGFNSCKSDSHAEILIETEYGNMTFKLYDETPKHKENFIKLVKERYYDGLLFHRIIEGFMVQGGDPDSRGASPDALLGMGGPGYTIPAEIGKKHIKGALAAARMGDQVNPQRESSGSQFYIVQGTAQDDASLDAWSRNHNIVYTDEEREKYKKFGGTPQLDGQYTVFGEIIEGMDVIDKLAAVEKNRSDRPIKDIPMKIRLIKD